MATNRPTKHDLVEAVREFLEKRIQPALEGESGFHTRIAINILKIIERELEHGPGLDAEEHERLRRLLERDGSLAELNSELCQRIRSGAIDIADEDLVRHLRQTTLGKLSIDNPEYSGYRRALEEAGRGGGKGTRP